MVPDISDRLDSFLRRVCAGSTQTIGVAVSSMHHIPENLNLHHTCYQNLRFPHSAAVYMHYHGLFSHYNNIQLHMVFYTHALLHLGLETTPLLMSFAYEPSVQKYTILPECVLIKFDIGCPHRTLGQKI